MSEVTAEKKYKLTRREPGKSQPCTFLKRPEGCRNGEKCPFSHGTANDQPGLNKEPPSSPTPLKKGKSDGVVKVSPSKTKKKQKSKTNGAGDETGHKTVDKDEVVDKTKKKKINGEIMSGGDGGSNDLKAKNKLCFGFKNGNCTAGDKCQFSHELSFQQQQRQTIRRLSNATTPYSSASNMMTTTKNASVNHKGPVPTAAGSGIGLSSLLSDLPVSPFPLERERKRTRFSIGGGSQLESQDVACPSPLPDLIHSFSDAWDTLVDLTCSHPMYSKHFLDVQDGDRVQALPCSDRCRTNSRESTYLPQVIALDCEMCMVEDPESGIRNGKELLRLSVVDGRPQKIGKKGKVEPRITLLDTLVKPSSPIVQMRSAIHGIVEQDLENVEFTKDHGRTALLKLSCPKTVVVGHALHNDLDALKLSHARVVDTALLFRVKDEPEATPSLRDVSKALLGTDIQDGIHDSVMDASIALAIAEKALDLVTAGEPLPHVERLPRNKRGLYDSLLVHRIPQDIKQSSVKELFMMKTSILPVDCEIFEQTSDTKFQKILFIFQSPAHANLAFDSLEGESTFDKANKLQKRVYTKSGSYVQVRKMVSEKPAEDPPAPQNCSQDDTKTAERSVTVNEEQTDIWK